MKVTTLSDNERVAVGYSHVLNLTYVDVALMTTATAKQVFPIPAASTIAAGTIVRRAAYKVRTGFVGASTTALTMKLGDGGDDDRYIAAKDVCAASGSYVAYWASAVATMPYMYTTTDGIDVIFTITGGTIGALSAGDIDIYLDLVPGADLPTP